MSDAWEARRLLCFRLWRGPFRSTTTRQAGFAIVVLLTATGTPMSFLGMQSTGYASAGVSGFPTPFQNCSQATSILIRPLNGRA
jgi:hypothetical protein